MSRPTRPRGVFSSASRTGSSGSFHAGAPIPTLAMMRRQTSQRYQTFPTPAPKTPLETPGSGDEGSSDATSEDGQESHAETPLPVKQLLLLAFLSLSEQTALNSISPYLPVMVESMPGIPEEKSGLYVGILASSFALAQLSTNFAWGYASDIVGRKPVLLMGTFALMCCFCVFGLCQKYWQVVVVHVAMGMLNGNAACVPTVLGEVTDRSNQSRAFTYLPVIYSLGSITGPALGGILVGRLGGRDYPYLAPNLLGAVMLAVSVVVVGIWFEETLEEEHAESMRPLWLDKFKAWLPNFGSSKPISASRRSSWSARWPRGNSNRPLLADSPTSSDDEGEENEGSQVQGDGDDAKSGANHGPPWHELLNSTTLILLTTYPVFQLSNISYNSLYPIFASYSPPTGRGLNPSKIGISLSLAGLATIIFQAFLFQPFKAKAGNLGTYRLSLLGIAISMVLMPWVGYADGEPPFGLGSARGWLYAELAVVLIIKNICAVGGLSSVMLLITNSAPSPASLGTLNGVAQTLSALGRSIGPFVSGGLFTLSTGLQPKGEALAWTLFGGLALVGAIGSVFIRGEGLESDDWEGADVEDEENQ